jgi:hypothetical protein
MSQNNSAGVAVGPGGVAGAPGVRTVAVGAAGVDVGVGGHAVVGGAVAGAGVGAAGAAGVAGDGHYDPTVEIPIVAARLLGHRDLARIINELAYRLDCYSDYMEWLDYWLSEGRQEIGHKFQLSSDELDTIEDEERDKHREKSQLISVLFKYSMELVYDTKYKEDHVIITLQKIINVSDNIRKYHYRNDFVMALINKIRPYLDLIKENLHSVLDLDQVDIEEAQTNRQE